MNTGNQIPAMTNPSGRYWEQPQRDAILIDPTHAVMTEATFRQLHEYSTSMPSGVYEGKMWRARVHFGLRAGGIQFAEPPVWLLRWYGPDPDPKFCSNHQREIILV